MRDGNIQMGGSGRPEQPRRAANDIAVMLQVASGRHQWPNNQLFALPAITYQLAEWLSGLSIGPSGLSCLSVPGCDKKVWGKEENEARWLPGAPFGGQDKQAGV